MRLCSTREERQLNHFGAIHTLLPQLWLMLQVRLYTAVSLRYHWNLQPHHGGTWTAMNRKASMPTKSLPTARAWSTSHARSFAHANDGAAGILRMRAIHSVATVRYSSTTWQMAAPKRGNANLARTHQERNLAFSGYVAKVAFVSVCVFPRPERNDRLLDKPFQASGMHKCTTVPA